MTYAFIHDVPADEQMYRLIRAKLPTETPKGMSCHLVIKRPEGGLRYVDVWETEADWDRFRTEHVEPVVDEILAGFGLPHDHSLTQFETLDVLEAWVGEPVTMD
jgi:hypothetical protein